MIHTDGERTIADNTPREPKTKKRAVTLPLPPVPAGIAKVISDELDAIFQKHVHN